jgi:hypothetical protein
MSRILPPTALLPFALALVSLLCGCAGLARTAYPPSPEPTDLEAALAEAAALRKENAELTRINRDLAYEVENLRIDLLKARAALDASGLQPAESVPAFREVQIDRVGLGMLTGPSNWDGRPGLDGIAVSFQVKDSEGTTLKRIGNVVFDLVDISDRKQDVVMSWAVPAQVLLDSWQTLPPGFRLKLPWRGDPPYGRELLLRSAFTSAAGREFTASITFRLEPEEKR